MYSFHLVTSMELVFKLQLNLVQLQLEGAYNWSGGSCKQLKLSYLVTIGRRLQEGWSLFEDIRYLKTTTNLWGYEYH